MNNPINPDSKIKIIQEVYNNIIDSDKTVKIDSNVDYSKWWEEKMAQDEIIITRALRGYCNNIDLIILKSDLIPEGIIQADLILEEKKSFLLVATNKDHTSIETIRARVNLNENIININETHTLKEDRINNNITSRSKDTSLTVNIGIISKFKTVSYDNTIEPTR